MRFSKMMVAAASLLVAVTAHSAQRDDFPSCYGMLGTSAPQQAEASNRELFVVIDQTLNPTVAIKRSVHRQVHAFLQPGDRLTLVKFSAFLADNYTDVVLTGQLDRPLNDDSRHSISKKLLKRFDVCMNKQKVHAKKKVDQTLAETFGREDLNIPKTELIGNLSTLSESLVAGSTADRKVVLLFSDMLENSDISSFYQKGSLRKIDPQAELAKFKAETLMGDWAGAEIFVIGAGLLPAKYADAYRSENRMRPIRKFWDEYFLSSNAQLKGWGQPALLKQIQ